MKTLFYLSTCDTCKRIIKTLELPQDVVHHDIKTTPITEAQLDALKALSGSYQALFSKRARLYKTLHLKEKRLSEADYKRYLLEHYTFLKRPVLVLNTQIFIGNSKSVIDTAKQALHE